MHSFVIRNFATGFERYKAALPGARLDWLARYRENAIALLKRQGLPGRKTEDWKYTSVRGLVDEEYRLATATPVAASMLPKATHLAVLVNGCFSSELSRLDKLPDGVRICGLADCLENNPEGLQASLGGVARLERHPFAALNSSFLADGLWIEVLPGVILNDPLIILFLAGDAPRQVTQPRLLVSMGEGADITLMEQYRGSVCGHFSNHVAEIFLARHARLAHVQVQRTRGDRLIQGTHVRCGGDSRYLSLRFDLGGVLVRHDLLVRLEEPGAECELGGLYIVGQGEHVDNHTRVDHLSPNCRSREYYKGVLGKGAHGVFNGKVIVHPAAQQTDAKLDNRNLVLSRDAEIDSKPELEIYADDVKCSHGSTVGELEQEPLFYLRSRGIDLRTARIMLIEAFTREVSDRLEKRDLRCIVETELNPCLYALANAEVDT